MVSNEKHCFISRHLHGGNFTISGGKRPSRLQKLSVPVLENELCRKWYSQEKKSMIIGDNSMCAGIEAGGKDACQVTAQRHRAEHEIMCRVLYRATVVDL